MIIPADLAERKNFLQFVVDTCTASQADRRALYDKRRRYFLFGQNTEQIVRFNRLKSHVPLLVSFLYAADQVAYSVAAPKAADEAVVSQYLAIEDDWNEAFQDDGLAEAFDQALTWAVVLDTMVVKQGWNDITKTQFMQLVEPSAFGVMREDVWDFASQQAMVHSYILDYDDAVARLRRAGLNSQIEKMQVLSSGSSDLGLPGSLNAMIISATGGTNIQGNVSGEINPSYQSSPSYAARVDQPVVRFHEAWVWDDESSDWRTFHLAEPNIIISDSKDTIAAILRQGGNKAKYDSTTNLFLKHENPFTPITPYPLYNYFWGDCHFEDLIPLQEWSTERLTQIAEILERQADPAKIFSGFMGIDDERAEALGGPGTWMADQTPGAKVDVLDPKMPEDLFREFEQIGYMFMEQSGFTEIMAGKGEKGVRGRGHARELKTTGAGRVRKVAGGLERPLVRIGDLGLRLKAKNDDEELRAEIGEQKLDFVAAQVLDDNKYTMRVAGHSHSPLFTAETQELAAMLFKAQAIDREWLVRLLNPPQKLNLLHALRGRLKQEAKIAQQRMQAGIPEHAQHRKPKAVAG